MLAVIFIEACPRIDDTKNRETPSDRTREAKVFRADIMEFEAERRFDHVTCLNFYPHIQDKSAFMQCVLERWLRPGGWLHVFHDLP